MSTIKVVFNEEVRRVQVAGAISAASYMKLEERIRSLFPALKDTRFVLVWQDDEGDEVSISSGSEFFEALQVMSFSHGVPRFIVKPVVGKASASTVHSSVTCDECGVSPIQGTRFKCTVRNDFDLCEGCEGRRSRPYPMIKITASDPLFRLSPFVGARGTHRGQGRECARGLPPQFQQIAGNPLVGHLPVRVSLSSPAQRTACHPLFAAFGCPTSPKSASSSSNNNKDAEEVKQLDSEVMSFLQAIGAIPRGEAVQQKAPVNTTTTPKSPAVAVDAEKTSAADRLESELTDILQAIFSGHHVTKNNNIGSNANTTQNTSSSVNISSSNSSSSANSASIFSTQQQQQGVTRDLNDEDEALQTAIRESLRVENAQEEEKQQHEEEEDVEDVWSESESVSSTDFLVNSSTSTPVVISESVITPSQSAVVPAGPTEEELLSQWKRELALLASMGFVDARALLPLLQTHVGSSAVSSNSSIGSSVAINEHRAEGLQRVVGELLRGKF